MYRSTQCHRQHTQASSVCCRRIFRPRVRGHETRHAHCTKSSFMACEMLARREIRYWKTKNKSSVYGKKIDTVMGIYVYVYVYIYLSARLDEQSRSFPRGRCEHASVPRVMSGAVKSLRCLFAAREFPWVSQPIMSVRLHMHIPWRVEHDERDTERKPRLLNRRNSSLDVRISGYAAQRKNNLH
jgi:hypothetical protein